MTSDEENTIAVDAADRVIAALSELDPADVLPVFAEVIAVTIFINFCAEHAREQLALITDLMRESLEEQIRGEIIAKNVAPMVMQ